MMGKKKNHFPMGQFSVNLDKDERRMIEELSSRRGLSRAGMIRLLIRERAQSEGVI